jgi:hypothetical protein
VDSRLLETRLQAIRLSPYRADLPARRPVRLGSSCRFPGMLLSPVTFQFTGQPSDPKTPPPVHARYAGYIAVRLVAHADCPVRCGTGNERRPGYSGIRVRPWVALSVGVRCSDTVAGRRRDRATEPASVRGAALAIVNGPRLDPPARRSQCAAPVDGYKEDRPPKPHAWLRGAVAIGRPDDSPRVHERLGSRRRL